MAGSFGSSDGDDLIFGINVTPLVDVILVLLIIFMITAPVLYQSVLKVDLPKARTGEKSEANPFSFTINKEGNVSWGKDPMNWSSLELKLKSYGNQLTDKTALISADEKTPHGSVIRLIDVLRNSGLTHFALNVESFK